MNDIIVELSEIRMSHSGAKWSKWCHGGAKWSCDISMMSEWIKGIMVMLQNGKERKQIIEMIGKS